MTRERRSLQDLMRSRQQSGFVGRRGQLVQYQDNLSLPPDDERRRFLFNIHGDAGIGKTYLTRQLRQIADDHGCLTAYTDHAADDVVSAMTVIAGEFSRADARLAEFDKRVAAYQQRRHELEADPHAPEGLASFATKTAVIIGLAAARDVPVAGSLLAPVDAAAAADQVDRARAYLARKFSDHADVRLLLSPADELTPVFVAGLERAAGGRPVALFFDTYERTSQVLDGWLRRLYAGQYGDLPDTLITTISGQHPLNPNLWADYLGVIADFPLEPFSDAEARQFLASKNIHDENMIQVILTLSGRLPMWLTTLAEARPADVTHIGDPAGVAVERFLKWEDDPARRAIAMTAALPRTLNQDVLAAITQPDQARELFGWLCGLPFVNGRAGAWVYHEVVRAAMMRLQYAQAPSQWRTTQVALAEANAHWARNIISNDDQSWRNARWVDYTREQTYHLLCADPVGNLPQALATAVNAAEHSTIRARQWAQLVADAGRDTNDTTLRQWGQRLQGGIVDDDLTGYLTSLINLANLDTSALVTALEKRGEGHQFAGRYAEALADFNRVIEFDPCRVWAIVVRGLTHLLMKHYDESLIDLARAIKLDPNDVWVIVGRGLIYWEMERYDDALADFNRAIDLDPSYVLAIVGRGLTYRDMERYDDALADFNRAIDLDPDFAWAICHRGLTALRLKRYEDALADFNRAIDLDPDDAWAVAHRGETYRLTKRYDDALADFNRAVELHPDDVWAIVHRGATYRAMKRDEDALADFNRAVELDPDERIVHRVETHEAITHPTKGH